MAKKITRTTKVSIYENEDGSSSVMLIDDMNTANNVRELYEDGYHFLCESIQTFEMDARKFYEMATVVEKGDKNND